MRLARKGSMSSCGDIGLNVLRKWIQSTVSCLLPLRLDKKEEIILYQPDNEVRLEVRLEDETVWLNRQQLSVLFNRDIKTIGKHVNNALKEELAGISVVANFATTAADGKTYQVDYYNQRRCSRSRNWAFRRRPLQSCCRVLETGHSGGGRYNLVVECCPPRRSRPAGSIGLCAGSYCRRASSARGRLAGSGLQIWHGEVMAT